MIATLWEACLGKAGPNEMDPSVNNRQLGTEMSHNITPNFMVVEQRLVFSPRSNLLFVNQGPSPANFGT